jgi:L-ornithine Nalpha-acyltransferase
MARGSTVVLSSSPREGLMALFSARRAFSEPAAHPLTQSAGASGLGSLRAARRDSAAAERLVGLTPHRLRLDNVLDPVLGRLGSLEVRLATTDKEVRQAQRLRFNVFYDEMSAAPNCAALLSRRDCDEYDPFCDHLLVLDHAVARRPFRPAKPTVVGTYRLLRQDVANRHFGFYTAREYDIAPLLAAHPSLRFLELGRSCVLKPYRTKRTVELLWRGIWAYVLRHRIDVMMGCASLEGADPNKLALPLSFLHHYARAPKAWRARAEDGRYVAMDMLGKEAVDPKAALKTLPPLIKGYLRLGAAFGDGAVVDRQFGTTDVLVVLPVSAISPRYIDHFGPVADRQAA